jgi:hypothetical protein
MPTFQDSLLMSELSDWINMLQPFHQPKPEKVAIRADIECDSAQSWSRPKEKLRMLDSNALRFGSKPRINGHKSMATNPMTNVLGVPEIEA